MDINGFPSTLLFAARNKAYNLVSLKDRRILIANRADLAASSVTMSETFSNLNSSEICFWTDSSSSSRTLSFLARFEIFMLTSFGGLKCWHSYYLGSEFDVTRRCEKITDLTWTWVLKSRNRVEAWMCFMRSKFQGRTLPNLVSFCASVVFLYLCFIKYGNVHYI